MGIPMRPPDLTPTSSPILAIWGHPRATIRRILETNPRQLVLPLIAAYGITWALQSSIDHRLADTYDPAALALIILIVGPPLSILTLYLNSWVTHLTATWLGGTGTPVSIRAAHQLPVAAPHAAPSARLESPASLPYTDGEFACLRCPGQLEAVRQLGRTSTWPDSHYPSGPDRWLLSRMTSRY